MTETIKPSYQIAKRSNYISIEFEGEDDWFEPSLKALNSICINLSGGYYEPKSERDAALARKLYLLLQDYSKELKDIQAVQS